LTSYLFAFHSELVGLSPSINPTYLPTEGISQIVDQGSVLCDLAAAVNAASVNVLSNWICTANIPNTPICNGSISSWGYYIGCSSNGFVSSINVSNLGLRGSLPTSLGQLSSLTALRAYSNSLSGTLPSSL